MEVLGLERVWLPATVDVAIAILTVAMIVVAGIRGVKAIKDRRLPGRAIRHSDPSFKGERTRAAGECTLATRSNSWYMGHLGLRHSLASAARLVIVGDGLGDLSPAEVAAAAAGWYCWGVLVADRTFSFTVFVLL